MTGQGRHLKAGDYRFDRAMTPFEVIDKIARGDVYVISVTFPEGLTIAEMAKIFESHGLGPASSFVQASRDPAPIRELDPAATDLEGYLFPETYALPRHTDAAKLARLMVAGFERVFTPELRQAAAARSLTVRQAVTLASIVEKETARPDERPIVAAVYTNRLRIGMALQCDPTVIYALQRAGSLHTATCGATIWRSTRRTTRIAIRGCRPDRSRRRAAASLEAAVHPADADYLYFVSRNDGSHAFARTLDEHNRNVQKYQVQYFRDKRLREGRVGRNGVGRWSQGCRSAKAFQPSTGSHRRIVTVRSISASAGAPRSSCAWTDAAGGRRSAQRMRTSSPASS